MKRVLLRAVVLVVSLAGIGAASAEIYRISPGSALAIGEGFDPRQPRRIYLPCIDHDGLWATGSLKPGDKPVEGKPYTTSAGFSFQSTQIESRKQLYEFVSISASVSGGYAFFSGSASFLSEDEFKFDEYSYHFAMKASTEFGEFRLIKPRLNADAQVALYRSPSAFFERCGTEFVGQQTRGAAISVVYSVHTIDQAKRSRIEASLSASFQGGVGSVGGNFNYKEVLAEALKTGSLKIHVYGFGGEGVAKLKDLVTNNTDVAKVKQTIQDYVQGLDVHSSVPVAYATGSMTSLDPRLGSMDFGVFNRYLAEYVVAYEDLLGYRDTLRKVLRGGTAQRLSAEEKQTLTTAFETSGRLVDQIVTKALTCRDDLSRRIASIRLNNHPAASAENALKCQPLSPEEVAFTLPRLPNPLPFSVAYGTGIYGVVPKEYLWLTVDGKGIQEANLVGGFSGLTKQHSGVLEILTVVPLSTGQDQARANIDLARLREKAPVAVAVKMIDGFTDYYELALPATNAGQTVSTLPGGEPASQAKPDAEVEVKKIGSLPKKIRGLEFTF